MVGLPKKKISSSRRGQRRSHDRLTLPTLMICPKCREKKPTHQVCPSCGTYAAVPPESRGPRRKFDKPRDKKSADWHPASDQSNLSTRRPS